MRWWLSISLVFSGTLSAQAPLHILAVERRGSPPYESDDRLYRVDGGNNRGLHPGDRLTVRRPGETKALGHLRMTEVRGDQAEGHFEPGGGGFPMKGDLVWREELAGMPVTPILDGTPMPPMTPAKPIPEAPPQEGVLFFLPQQAELSPAGLKKLETWVHAWGSGGRWVLHVPNEKTIKPALQKQRIETLRTALKNLGLEQVALVREPRTTEGKNDPAWIRHWD